MVSTSYGDMAQYIFLRSRSVELNSELDKLTAEASTGIASDLVDKLSGELGFVADLERNISKMQSYQVASQEAALFSSTAQAYVDRINDNAQDLGTDILGLTSTVNATVTEQLSSQAMSYLRETVSNLNGQLSGRSLFSGTATSTTPLESADTMMTALVAQTSALTTGEDVANAVEAWFDSPTGFDAVMYNGATTNMSAVKISSDQEVNFALRADDEAFKDAMKSFAMAALASEDYLNLPGEEAHALLEISGTNLVNAQSQLTSVQSDLGFVESRIEETQAMNSAALTSMSTTLNDLILANPEETASRIEEVQYQLEALYTITVKSSNLKLLNYL